MPPFLVALIVAGVAALAYRKKPASLTVVSENTPGNGGVGITTGFAPPPIQSSVAAPTPSTGQTNSPSTAASGVPNYSANTNEFAGTNVQPGPGQPFSPFYNQAQLNGPIQSSIRMRPSAMSTSGGSGCGCGGGHTGASDCAQAAARNKDSGCLAPTRRVLLNSASPKMLEQWSSNIEDSGNGPWEAIQQMGFDAQQSNPHGQDVSPPVAANLTGIGLSYRRGVRSSEANF